MAGVSLCDSKCIFRPQKKCQGERFPLPQPCQEDRCAGQPHGCGMVWMDRGLTSAIDEAGTVLTEKASNLESSLNRICEESILQAERKPLDAEYASRS